MWAPAPASRGGAAIRAGDAIDSQPVAEAVRQLCGSRSLEVTHQGAVRFDNRTTDHLLYMNC